MDKTFKIIKEAHGEIFKEIEDKFEACKKNNKHIDFIKYILEKHPYKDYNKDDHDFSKMEFDLLDFLLIKYLLDDYTPIKGDSDSELNYYIINEIYKKISYLYMKYKDN